MVVVERNPTYYNLVGQVEYRATIGAMVTGFHHITPGAFHRASGGLLILHALDVLTAPFAWEALTLGQINGVTIADLDDYAFGLPVPLTARIALGHGTVQSIDREVKLRGPIHAKGMVTLASHLARSPPRTGGWRSRRP